MMFETERLILRHLTTGDADDMVDVYGDAEVMAWVDDGQPLGKEGCLRWWRSQTATIRRVAMV